MLAAYKTLHLLPSNRNIYYPHFTLTLCHLCINAHPSTAGRCSDPSIQGDAPSNNSLWEKKTTHVIKSSLYLILQTTINTKQAVNKLFRKLITKAIYCQVQDCVKAKHRWKVKGPTLQIFSPSSSLLSMLLVGLLGEEPIWSTYFTIQCPSSNWKEF